MENGNKQIRVDITLNLKQNGDEITTDIAMGFVKIERRDLRIAKLVCNSQMKDFIIKQCNHKYGDVERWFWGAEYVIDESIETPKIVLLSEDYFCDCLDG